MIFVGGVFIPIQALPFQLRVISCIQFTIDLAVLLVWVVVLQTVAVIVLDKKTQFQPNERTGA